MNLTVDCFFRFLENEGAEHVYTDSLNNSVFVVHFYRREGLIAQIRSDYFCLDLFDLIRNAADLGIPNSKEKLMSLSHALECVCER